VQTAAMAQIPRSTERILVRIAMRYNKTETVVIGHYWKLLFPSVWDHGSYVTSLSSLTVSHGSYITSLPWLLCLTQVLCQ